MMEIMIGQKIDSNLGQRLSAKDFFKELNNTSENDIIINFENVEFISRSFAHEYIHQKDKTSKNIIEKNIPIELNGMFEVVCNSLNS